MDEKRKGIESEIREAETFLESGLRISFEISPEAREFLPEITQADIASGRERYRLFLGKWTKGHGDARVSIQAIVEFDDDPAAVSEGAYEVVLNLAYVNQYIEDLKRSSPEFADMEIVGDIHTHPVLPDQMSRGVKPWDPSTGDLEDIVQQYERGTIRMDQPFIFGIAAPNPNHPEQTVYAYYHMEKEGDVWKFKRVS